MANKKFIWAGILVMVLVFGMALVACDSGSSDAVTGTWTDGEENITFSDGDFEFTELSGIKKLKGSYSLNGNDITLTPAQYWGPFFIYLNLSAKWYSRSDLVSIINASDLNMAFTPITGTVSGSSLTLRWNGFEEYYTKK